MGKLGPKKWKDPIYQLADSCTLITAKEERALAHRIQRGGGAKTPKRLNMNNVLKGLSPDAQQAVHQLVHANVPLAISVARKYVTTTFVIDDAVQEAILGLYFAARRFRPEKFKTKFSTYAMFWCKRMLRRGERENVGVIRVSQYARELSNACKNGDLDNLPKRHRDIVISARLAQTMVSFSDEMELAVEDKKMRPPPDKINQGEICLILMKALNKLPKRLALIVKLRYGIDARGPMSLEAIGKLLNICRERVRQLEVDAFRLLRGTLHEYDIS